MTCAVAIPWKCNFPLLSSCVNGVFVPVLGREVRGGITFVQALVPAGAPVGSRCLLFGLMGPRADWVTAEGAQPAKMIALGGDSLPRSCTWTSIRYGRALFNLSHFALLVLSSDLSQRSLLVHTVRWIRSRVSDLSLGLRHHGVLASSCRRGPEA